MNKVPGEISVTGNFLGKESDFAIWIANHGLDGTIIKPNLAIISCVSGQEDQICQILNFNKPFFVNYINQTQLLW